MSSTKSQTTSDTLDLLLSAILDMGELLLTSGAEVLRVEDTLKRLCTAYGFSQINVLIPKDHFPEMLDGIKALGASSVIRSDVKQYVI